MGKMQEKLRLTIHTTYNIQYIIAHFLPYKKKQPKKENSMKRKISKRRKLCECFIHTAAATRLKPSPQPSVASLTPQLPVISCLFRVSHRVYVALTSMPSPQLHKHEVFMHTYATHISWTDVSHLCHLKRRACQEQQGFFPTPNLSIPFLPLSCFYNIPPRCLSHLLRGAHLLNKMLIG